MAIDASIRSDIDLLRKYQIGRVIDPIDIHNLNKLASIGFIKKGIILQDKKVTAKTTAVGVKILSDIS